MAPGAVVVGVVLAGYLLQRRQRGTTALVAAWVLGILALVAIEVAVQAWSPLQRMLALVAAMLSVMKAIVGVAARTPLPAGRWLLFCLWPGMHPRTFATRAPRAGAGRLVREAALSSALGLSLLVLARLVPLGATGTACAVFVGSSALVHFGVFAGLAAILRCGGFPAERLFRAPWRARSLAEFWSQRWNLGFVEMTTLAVQRPLRQCGVGPGVAMVVSFLFSGVLHECAITLPVRAGYGLPLTYFALQAVLVALERPLGLRGRTWTFTCLLLPVPLLFPPEFRAMIVSALVT